MLKLKIITIIVTIIFLGYGMVNVIMKNNSRNKVFNVESMLCMNYINENRCIRELNITDLKNSDVEFNKALFNSYSNGYKLFDGGCYEDKCLELLKCKIPNIGSEAYLNFYYNFNGLSGVVKEVKSDYDEAYRIKEINFI